jgi:hypothetical protein
MLGDGALTFREFVMKEPLPLATIHAAVLEFLRGRQDAVLFGAQAVNAYVDAPRMTQDVDILSNRAAELAEELRHSLSQQFQIAVRVRSVREGSGFRLYQVRKPKNRHLVEVRHVDHLPPAQAVGDMLVVDPAVLVCHKILSMVSRPKTAKGLTDAADLRRLLLAFPDLKKDEGDVLECLRSAGATQAHLNAWRDVVSQEILPDEDDD